MAAAEVTFMMETRITLECVSWFHFQLLPHPEVQ